ELLDVNRGVDVLFGDALADEDRVFEVVALPGHERDDHVLTERELTHVGRRTVGENVTLLHVFARADDRLLVVAGALVGALILGQVIDVGHLITLTRDGADDDAFGVDTFDDAFTLGDDTHAGVDCDATFHRGADQRRFGPYQRHGLTLHVGAHECAVRVVVLQEGHERRGNAHHLIRRDVHQLDLIGDRHAEVTVQTGADQVVDELLLVVEVRARLRDVLAFFFERAEPLHVRAHLSAADGAVGGLDEAVLVHASEAGERRDQTDVRTFRRLDRADTAVVRGVHVAHLEAGAFASQTTWSEGREATLVRHFAERIGLIHELRELRAAEVLLDHRAHGLGVEQVVRHQGVDFLRHAHALFDRASHANQTDAVLVLHQLTDRAHATVTEVIDVVHRTAAVLELDQVPNGFEDVTRREYGLLEVRLLFLRKIPVKLVVQLEAADRAQVVALRVEEQVVEQLLGGLERWRITGAQAPVDLHDRVLGGLHLVGDQRVAQVRADVQTVDEQHLELGHVRLAQTIEGDFSHLFVALEQDFARFL